MAPTKARNIRAKAASISLYRSPWNIPDKNGNTSLHRAIINNDLEFLEHILSDENLERNPFNNEGQTPLTLSFTLDLDVDQNCNVIKMLLMGGCDPNIPNKSGWYPLHMALDKSLTTSAHALIKAGADVDAESIEWYTPLYYAIFNNNLEAVCMLLYYGADVTIARRRNIIAFDYAFMCNVEQIVYELIDYYDCFSDTAEDDYKIHALHLPFFHRKVFACRNNAEIFKKIWLKSDYRLLLVCKLPFFPMFFAAPLLDMANMTPDTCAGWLECLYMILDSDIAIELIQSCNNLHVKMNFKLFGSLFRTFNSLGIGKKDRVAITEIYISLGAAVYFSDIHIAVVLFGFDDEVEALIRAYDDSDESELLAQTAFICFVNREPTPEEVFKYLKRNEYIKNRTSILLTFLSFFFMPIPRMNKLLRDYCYSIECLDEVDSRIETLPSVPSLVEVCRNKIRRCLKKTRKYKKTYQFHDAINSLKLPTHLKDILRFKTSLY